MMDDMPRRSDSKERMIAAARRLFREHGYFGTALSEVVSESSAPRGSLYFHFPGGKEELATEVALAHSADSPRSHERVMGDTGVLGLFDDVNAVSRVHEIFEYLESPDAGEEADDILRVVKRQLCNYYSTCAYELVKGQLLPVIIGAAEELLRTRTLTAVRTRALIIAAQSAAS